MSPKPYAWPPQPHRSAKPDVEPGATRFGGVERIIAVGPADADGNYTAMLLPGDAELRGVRKIRNRQQLEALKAEWGVDEAQGEGLADLPD